MKLYSVGIVKAGYEMSPMMFLVQANTKDNAIKLAQERVDDLAFQGEKYDQVIVECNEITDEICTSYDQVLYFKYMRNKDR